MAAKGRGDRLRPVADSLAAVGFVSKGDSTLRDHQAQVDYFKRITKRYLEFCSDHRRDLDAALASLPLNRSNDATSNPPAAQPSPKLNSTGKPIPQPSTELSTLLLSLRKLREAIMATAATTPIPFAQQVHVFSIRLAIRARHPPSYYPSLKHSLHQLHSDSHPLPDSEYKDLVSYLILDYACREEDMVSAFELRARARQEHGFRSQTVDQVLDAVMHDNWIVFWQVYNRVDSYLRAVMNWAVDRVRRHALKAVGSAYFNVHVSWILGGCTGDEENWTWEKLVATEKLGWEKEGDRVIIRRPKARPAPKPEPANA
ncbi:SAC3/GANP/Nin1/mts3/eIF-3 p25 [Penicillium capsulatum]|uniref:SAC3/GANP/Nin1/mts3/eIF-3 p25 n=1 Tax=Penicillium capsulatum TaxID=69766 RepID=A0A9W9HRN4_9EURO|nr:SAC3/GANP/Nin1/mts3/eIF-3 p25 [Penicillium capsulatum]KAJ6105704.1 SAC3/GANP/Nin1/mts3/eIF-3 p25 [Penicillium capsulatum]